MDVSRRQLVTLGAAGAAGVVASRVAGASSPAGAGAAFGGIHIFVTGKVVDPAPPPGVPDLVHTFIITMWGPDNALSGIGNGYSDKTPDEEPSGGQVRSDWILGTGVVGCVFGATAKIDGDVVKGKGIMMYSGSPDEKMGQPFPFEAHLSTGFVSARDMNMGMGTELTVTGTGVVARI
jgi:hypothetical protein